MSDSEEKMFSLPHEQDGGIRLTADEMDEKRKGNIAYEYLCHLEEAKVWIEACINEKLPPTTDLEEVFRNGVYLAKLAHFFAPEIVPLRRIYDKDQTRYNTTGALHFRHTDNINMFLRAMDNIGFPKLFHPETTDIYDKKNMPRLTYCLHGLSLFLFKLGVAPQIQDLYGKVHFTEEEISAMRRELERYGIQMPAFSKIGGMLTNEMPEDEAELHAAIIAINEAIDRQLAEETLAALGIPQAHLVNVVADHAADYQSLLYNAKKTKADVARNKSIDLEYQPDVYDELLTQAEIQGNINKMNVQRALSLVNSAVDKEDVAALSTALNSKQLSLKEIDSDKMQFYMDELRIVKANKMNNNDDDDSQTMLDRDDVQKAIQQANLLADTEYQKKQAVEAINRALDERDGPLFIQCLRQPGAQLPPVHEEATPLYLDEFLAIKDDKGEDLSYEEILGGVKVLTAIAAINLAIDSGAALVTWSALQCPDAHLIALEETNLGKYQERMLSEKIAKEEESIPFLTHVEVQECVDIVNGYVREENDKVSAIAQINEAVDLGDPRYTLDCLVSPRAKLRDVYADNSILYHTILTKAKLEKTREFDDDEAVLWYEDIQSAILDANSACSAALALGHCMKQINSAVKERDSASLLNGLTNRDSGLVNINSSKCTDGYLERLCAARENKRERGDCGSGWLMLRTDEAYKFYFNVLTDELTWEKPCGKAKDHALLTRDEVQVLVDEVTSAFNRQLLFEASEGFVIKVQSVCRGYLVRRALRDRLRFLEEQTPAAVRIQAFWRGAKQRRQYRGRLEYLKNNRDTVVQESFKNVIQTEEPMLIAGILIETNLTPTHVAYRLVRNCSKIQSVVRMWLTRRRCKRRQDYYRENVDAIVKIQAFFRSNKARQDFRALLHDSNPPLQTVRRFVHLLENSDVDYSEEIELQRLREQVVTEIRSNQSLEEDLSKMDIKIGLLVKNRITLQDVVQHNKRLKDYRESRPDRKVGLKALSKESREKLDAYQHLFYLLQTNPVYLAKLIFEMPQSKSTTFMESVILALYNYASNNREEYLLLKLFTTALEEEIRSKVDKMSDIVTGNPLVVKMAVDFNRSARGHSCLSDLLNPLVTEILERKELRIITNPSDIYKQWINQLESETGRASGMPYDVTVQEALKHDFVLDRIQKSIEEIKQCTDRFLNSITKSVDKIPYGMRYVAKVMKRCLHEQFPNAPEKDILKIVGNLLYYRYINSAIVAPDAFDIITVQANKGLTTDQRRNLGSIAKILQFAASNKGYGGESEYLACLNPYIRDAHEVFKYFFRACCDVEEPELHFNMDKYSDFCMVTKPIIYISLREILDTHQLLCEHQDKIAPDHNDPLHEILEDLGDVQDIEHLIGGDHGDGDASAQEMRERLAKIETMLTLTNKFQVEEDNMADLKSILVRTKRMVVDVIRVQDGETLTQILATEATDAQEELHQALMRDRQKTDQKAHTRTSKLVKQQSVVDEYRLPLEHMKSRIVRYLEKLTEASVTDPHDNYQFIVNSIVQDIRNQRLYRQRRKHEMLKLKTTLHILHNKRAFFEEQIDYYSQYVRTCLDNLTKNQRRTKSRSWFGSEKKAPTSLKYSAQKLHEKGILYEIDGLPDNQFKNLLFEIKPTPEPGVFEVHASFMGVNMDKVNVVLQDLLQLQYEGVAVYKMFNRTKVNVNLMIFLLNTKFYGR